jgi:hypothetical protein
LRGCAVSGPSQFVISIEVRACGVYEPSPLRPVRTPRPAHRHFFFAVVPLWLARHLRTWSGVRSTPAAFSPVLLAAQFTFIFILPLSINSCLHVGWFLFTTGCTPLRVSLPTAILILVRLSDLVSIYSPSSPILCPIPLYLISAENGFPPILLFVSLMQKGLLRGPLGRHYCNTKPFYIFSFSDLAVWFKLFPSFCCVVQHFPGFHSGGRTSQQSSLSSKK